MTLLTFISYNQNGYKGLKFLKNLPSFLLETLDSITTQRSKPHTSRIKTLAGLPISLLACWGKRGDRAYSGIEIPTF